MSSSFNLEIMCLKYFEVNWRIFTEPNFLTDKFMSWRTLFLAWKTVGISVSVGVSDAVGVGVTTGISDNTFQYYITWKLAELRGFELRALGLPGAALSASESQPWLQPNCCCPRSTMIARILAWNNMCSPGSPFLFIQSSTTEPLFKCLP